MNSNTNNNSDSEDPTATIPATLRYDPTSHFYWLAFDGRADDATIAGLKRLGWRWSGYRQQWRNNRRNAPFLIPASVDVYDGGECDYSRERADRLNARADCHYDAYQTHHASAHAKAERIPFGQPILKGHHSQRRDERYRERIHKEFGRAFAELDKSNELRGKAQASQRHQAWKATAPAMARRLERLQREERQLERILTGLSDRAERGEDVTTYRAQCEWRVGRVRTEIAELTERIESAGGLLADQVEVHVGDLIRLDGDMVIVTRVNPKSYSGTIHAPNNRNLHGWKVKRDRSKFGGIVRRAGDTESPPTFAEVLAEQNQQGEQPDK